MTNTELLANHYRQNKQALINKIKRRLFDQQDAEDVVMEAFSKAMSYIGSYDPTRNISSWFNTILNNCVKDYRKSFLQGGDHPMHSDYQEFDELDEEFSSEDGALNVDHIQVDLIKQEIAVRTGDTGEILRMYFLEDMAPSDIKFIVDATNKSVRTIIHRFKQEMRDKYSAM